MTGGAGAGTSGGKAGTSGWRIEWVPLAVIAAVGVVVAVINATSLMMEVQTGGPFTDVRAIWLHEISSVVMVVALSPLIGWMVHRFPPPGALEAGPWARVAAIHFVAATVFSLAHIIGMVAIRKLGYASAGSYYVFAYNNDLIFPFVYEWRKDVLTYASNAVVYWGWGFWLAQKAAEAMTAMPSPAPVDTRIEIRDGSRIILVDPVDIAWVEAAGNYVEIHTAEAAHLARGTLAGFVEKLGPRGFVRIHRSRLVNRARVKAFKPTPSGDLEITLDDGRVIAASRRYRGAIDGA